jgi:hypothetical protein
MGDEDGPAMGDDLKKLTMMHNEMWSRGGVVQLLFKADMTGHDLFPR